MSTPPKATPTTPQWAIEAQNEILVRLEEHMIYDKKFTHNEPAAIIAKHAPPPAAQPSDAALRAKILAGLDYCMDWKNKKPDAVKFACAMADARQYIIDLTALAPYLKGEPGDSELLDWLLDYITHHGLNGLKKLAWTCYDEDGESLMHRKTVSEEEVGDCRFDRAAIRAAMRGEGRAE